MNDTFGVRRMSNAIASLFGRVRGLEQREEAVYWYARANGVHRLGTFATQLAAWEAVMGLDGTPILGATVWCESKIENRGWLRKRSTQQ
jgi:hypothetical protein